MEIWKDIKGYEGLYQVSNLGNVRSLNWKGTGIVRNLCPQKLRTGYPRVLLSKYGEVRTCTVHRLVAIAFLDNPDNLPEVNHKDENKENNCVDNLEWCSHKYNVDYYVNLHPTFAQERTYTRKNKKRSHLKVCQCDLDGNVIKVWDNSRTVFVQTGMSDWSISRCCRGTQKTAYGYRWRYAT